MEREYALLKREGKQTKEWSGVKDKVVHVGEDKVDILTKRIMSLSSPTKVAMPPMFYPIWPTLPFHKVFSFFLVSLDT